MADISLYGGWQVGMLCTDVILQMKKMAVISQSDKDKAKQDRRGTPCDKKDKEHVQGRLSKTENMKQ